MSVTYKTNVEATAWCDNEDCANHQSCLGATKAEANRQLKFRRWHLLKGRAICPACWENGITYSTLMGQRILNEKLEREMAERKAQRDET